MTDGPNSPPAEMTASAVMSLLTDGFGICGCVELDEVHASLLRLLEWHERESDDRPSFDELYPESGVFYLLSARLEALHLTEHGGSARHGWITEDGRRLLTALRRYGPDEIGEAKYDVRPEDDVPPEVHDGGVAVVEASRVRVTVTAGQLVAWRRECRMEEAGVDVATGLPLWRRVP